MKRHATAVWQGSLKEGKGRLGTGSGVLDDTPYSFSTRFEDEPGTNPEELIGAAYAGCFSMAFSLMLTGEGMEPEEIESRAAVSLDKVEGGFAITGVHLDVTAKVPGASDEDFQRIARQAKDGCPVSQALDVEITMDARQA